ncbi:MAG: hypothetical protein QOE41_4069 [Mycobacterium sp.]|nr:hypothetical protein [Mycobacterium sp.]
MTEVLALLSLHRLSSGDFAPALEQFLGSGAGLSAAMPSTDYRTRRGGVIVRARIDRRTHVLRVECCVVRPRWSRSFELVRRLWPRSQRPTPR